MPVYFLAALEGAAIAATVTTHAVTEISYTTAVANGSLSEPFYLTVRAYGVCWSTTGEPSVEDQCTDEGRAREPIDFSSKMDELTPGTTYFVKAYAEDWLGVTYGDVEPFTTKHLLPKITTQPVTDIKAKSATGHGTVVDLGITNPTQHGVCWNTDGSPTIDDKKTEEGAVAEIGEFSSEIKGLRSNRTYYVRAYATNSEGTAYGNEVKFSTNLSPPTVTTQGVTDIGANEATANGTVTDLGSSDPFQHGFCWNTTGMPELEDKKTEQGAVNQTGAFSSIISELLSNTTYFVRAYASNDFGTVFGDEVSFTTQPMPPLVSTDGVSGITTNKASVHGTIIHPGVPASDQHGVCWNTSGNPGIEDNKTEEGPVSHTGEFSSGIDELLPDTTYYARTYASNTAGTSYGDEITFTTINSALAPAATLTDIPAKITSAKSYTLHVGGIGVVAYKYRLDNDDWSGERAIGDAITLKLSLDEEGLHTLSVLGKDAAGMWQSFDNPTIIAWHMDTTPPQAELSNYPAGMSNTAEATVTVGGFDVASYRYRLDSGEWSGIFQVDTLISLSNLSAGDHLLEVIGADLANNWQDKTHATSISWTNNSTIPTAVLINVPEVRTTQTTANISVTFPINGIPIDAYTYTIDDGHTWWQNDAHEPIELTGLSEGAHSLCVNAFGNGVWQDSLDGMSSTVNATCIQWRVDVTPPNPAVLSVETSPSSSVLLAGMPGTISANLSWHWSSDDELETIQRYRVWYSEEHITEANLNDAVEVFCDLLPGFEGFIEVFSLSGFVPGRQYHFGVRSIDQAGNLSGLSNIVKWTPEDQLPKISSLELTEGGLSTDNATTNQLTIIGDNFLKTAGCNRVRFERAPHVFDVAGKSGAAHEIVADIPLGLPPGAYRVRVINKNGISKASYTTITITEVEIPVPVVTGIHPLIAETGTQTVLKILGKNFDQEVAGVNLLSAGGTQTPLSNVTVHDSQTITAVIDVPQNFPEGSHNVLVTLSNGLFNEVSAVKVELCLPLDLQDETASVVTAKMITNGKGVIPATTILTTDDRDEVSPASIHRSRIKLFIEPGSAIEIGDPSQTTWTDYTGSIRPPRQIQTHEAIIDTLGTASVSFSIGIDDPLRLRNGKTMFVLIETTVADSMENPAVYHVSPQGELSLAGVNGQWRAMAISKGGTVLSKRFNTPEESLTTYTIGLLLDSMSDYAIGSNRTEDPFDNTVDQYGFCFIRQLHAANIVLFHGIMAFVMVGLALIVYLKRQCR